MPSLKINWKKTISLRRPAYFQGKNVNIPHLEVGLYDMGSLMGTYFGRGSNKQQAAKCTGNFGWISTFFIFVFGLVKNANPCIASQKC